MRIDSLGNVAIGSIGTPSVKLDVAGTIRMLSGGMIFPDGSFQTTALSSNSVVTGNNVTQIIRANQTSAGVGTFTIGTPPPSAIRGDATAASNIVAGVLGTSSSPSGYGVLGENLATTGNAIGVFGVTAASIDGTGVWGESTATSGGNAVGVFGHSVSSTGTGVFGFADSPSGDAVGVYGRSLSVGGTGVWGEVSATTGVNFGLYGKTSSTQGAPAVFDNTSPSNGGNLIIGRASNPLAVVFRVDSFGKVFANGGLQPSGADFAESVSVREEAAVYEPGDLIGIDSEGIRRFTKLDRPYSPLVAGIYSTKPGILATPHLVAEGSHEADEIPLAIVGIVPCKVSDENGTISTGDMLVSSSKPGYAMKGTDRNRMIGAVIGKALQPMRGKTGVIEILVSLQ
jgi:hypothetical protein